MLGAALVVLWLALGAPWLPAAAAAAATVLVRRRVVPHRIRRPLPAAAVVGAVVLAVEVSGWVWPLLAAGALVAVLPPARVGGRDRRRTPVLLVVAGVLVVGGTAGLVVEHLERSRGGRRSGRRRPR